MNFPPHASLQVPLWYHGSVHRVPKCLTLTSVTPETPQQMDLTKIQTEICRVNKGSSQAHTTQRPIKNWATCLPGILWKNLSLCPSVKLLLSQRESWLAISFVTLTELKISQAQIFKTSGCHISTQTPSQFIQWVLDTDTFIIVKFFVKFDSFADCENQLFEVS